MELMHAIYDRRAVRSYSDRPVDEMTLRTLIHAAIQAPSAMNQQPWAFGIVQDKTLLKSYSDRAKAHFLSTAPTPPEPDEFHAMLGNPEYNIFYNAGTLVIICARTPGGWSQGDCCLAAQNFMLAAYGMGLATCPIGFSLSWLNLPETRAELGIPASYEVVFPVIVGYPGGDTPHTARQEPELLFWKAPAALPA